MGDILKVNEVVCSNLNSTFGKVPVRTSTLKIPGINYNCLTVGGKTNTGFQSQNYFTVVYYNLQPFTTPAPPATVPGTAPGGLYWLNPIGVLQNIITIQASKTSIAGSLTSSIQDSSGVIYQPFKDTANPNSNYPYQYTAFQATGLIQQNPGTTLYFQSYKQDDGVNIYINGVQVLNANAGRPSWSTNASVTYSSGPVTLTSQYTPITVCWFNGGEYFNYNIQWSTDGTTWSSNWSSILYGISNGSNIIFGAPINLPQTLKLPGYINIQNNLQNLPIYWNSYTSPPIISNLGAYTSAASNGLNNNGVIVGTGTNGLGTVPVYWPQFNQNPVVLNTGSYSNVIPNAINSFGIVVGSGVSGGLTYPLTWSSLSAVPSTLSSGTYSNVVAVGLNSSSNAVVGYGTSTGTIVPLYWSNLIATPSTLDLTGYSSGVANGISASGSIVGSAGSKGVYWSSNTSTVSTLSSDTYYSNLKAFSINNSNEIVGIAGVGNTIVPVYWSTQTSNPINFNLGSFVKMASYSTISINDLGNIVAYY